MKMSCRLVVAAVALLLPACDLVKATGLQTDYSFDAIEYTSPTFGSSTAAGATVPTATCGDPSQMMDPCGTADQPGTNVTFTCNTVIGKCEGSAVIRVSETIDLAQETENMFPMQAIEDGIDTVDVKRVTYWVNANQLDVAVPNIDFYVAPMAAQDETDKAATLLTSVAMIAATSNVCTDAAYPDGDPKASSSPVCSASLTQAGKSALSAYVKSYETPFQIIAHTTITVMAGDPIPAGSISFSARPTVGLKILK
jgi:hypothetical protein